MKKRQKKAGRVSRAISMALVSIGLMASLASANPKSIEETTLSLKDLFADLSAAEEADAINQGSLSAGDQGSYPTVSREIPNEVMLGPVVRIERKTTETPESL